MRTLRPRPHPWGKGSQQVAFGKKQVPISSKNSMAARNAHAKAREKFKTYDTSAIQPKGSKVPIIICVVVVLLVIVGAAFAIRGCTADAETLPEGQEAVVTIQNGAGAKDIANTLLDAKLIGNADKFVDYINKNDAAAALIPGTYLFHGGTTHADILSALMQGPASTADHVTIPEGLTRQGVADAVQEATSGRITADAFMAATADASAYDGQFDMLASAGNNSLEGYLFPKTYSITAADGAEEVAEMMLAQFGEETTSLDWSYAEERGLTPYEAVILASIVEKEGMPDNFATVASVFYNRLASDRPYLESDATTAYEVGHDPTPDEVHAETPYSTYTNEGLPPTPICNPSLAALQAVCAPEETDYLFFYFSDDGTYSFSETYEEHQESFS